MLTGNGIGARLARVEAGVFGYLVTVSRDRPAAAIHTAQAACNSRRARGGCFARRLSLAARKAIERAKGLLMEKENLTEDEAFARLRKASQVSGRPLRVIAEAVVATLTPES